MCDIFTKENVLTKLRGKSVLFLGDSLMRSLYKDFVYLTKENAIIPNHINKDGRYVFDDEKLIRRSPEGSQGRDYEELRDYYVKEGDLQLTFLFLTRCFSDMLEDFLMTYPKEFGSYPDLILLNSALWDVNRWGPNGIELFKNNIDNLFKLFTDILPDHTQVCFMTTPPISVEIQSGFLIKQLEFQRYSMRFFVLEANKFAARVTASYGFDVIDMHFHFLHQLHRRCHDGLHWNPDAVRLQTNIILTHFCIGNDIPLPGNVESDNHALKQVLQVAENSANFDIDKPEEGKPEEETSDEGEPEEEEAEEEESVEAESVEAESVEAEPEEERYEEAESADLDEEEYEEAESVNTEPEEAESVKTESEEADPEEESEKGESKEAPEEEEPEDDKLDEEKPQSNAES